MSKTSGWVLVSLLIAASLIFALRNKFTFSQPQNNPTGVSWTQAQSFIEDFNGSPLISVNATGTYAPFILRENKLTALMPEWMFKDVDDEDKLDFLSPTALSSTEVILAGRPVQGRDIYDLYLYDTAAKTLANLTNSPGADSGSFCLDKASRRIAWSENQNEVFGEISRDHPAKIKPIKTANNTFMRCYWQTANLLYGIQRIGSGVVLWKCDLSKEADCQPMRTLETLVSFMNFFPSKDGALGFIGQKKGRPFREAYLLSADGAAFSSFHPEAKFQGDVLDIEGDDVRIGLHSRYYLSSAIERETIVYKTLNIGGIIFGVVADQGAPRRLAKLVDGHWQDVGQVLQIKTKSPAIIETWIQYGLENDVVQAFYFGDLNPERVVVWWHGGPKENVSPRYNAYYDWLNKLGYGVLAVNYPGSTGRGLSFEDQFNPSYVGYTVEAVLRFLQENNVRYAVSWSVSAGSRIQDVILQNRHPFSAIVDQATMPVNPQRRGIAAAMSIPYFSVQGEFDTEFQQSLQNDFTYHGGHDITQIEDFSNFTNKLAEFLKTAKPIPEDQTFPDKKIVLDAGHDGNSSDPNMVGDLRESTLTFELSRALQKSCLKSTPVALTRSASASLKSQPLSLERRAKLRGDYALPFVSLHFNASTKEFPSENLSSVFIPFQSPPILTSIAQKMMSGMKSLGLGTKIEYPELGQKIRRTAPGVFERGLALLKQSEAAPCSFLVEATYYDDPKEHELLKQRSLSATNGWDYARIESISRALCPGILEAVKCPGK